MVLQQLYHVGQHGDSDLSYMPHWSPSGRPSYHDSDGSHAMSAHEIDEMIDAFVAAAVRCRQAGFDGVEIWAAYHSLLEQFWTPWSNDRDDKWGGSLENRTRLSRTILERTRSECGEDFIIGMSISTSDAGGVLLGTEELTEIVAPARCHRTSRLCDLRFGRLSRLRQADADIRSRREADNTGHGCPQAGRDTRENPVRKSHPHAGQCRTSHRIGRSRPGVDREGPDRRPASGQQDPRRPYGGCSPLYFMQSDVLGPSVP